MTRAFPNLRLRAATLDDAKILLSLRNDPMSVENSRGANRVSEDEHNAWLQKNIGSDACLIYIAEDGGNIVGMVRAEKKKSATELSWIVAPNSRGKGYGKVMTQLFVRSVVPHDTIIACIKEGNKPSESIAKSLGLKKAEKENPQDERSFTIWRL